MTKTELDELSALIASGESSDRAAVLGQQFVDWKRNLAKQEAQSLAPAFEACATIEEVQALAQTKSAGASAETIARIKELARARVGVIAVGV